MNKGIISVSFLVVIGGSAGLAHAHQDLVIPAPKYPLGNQKTAPCGNGGAEGTDVTAYLPGETISITVKETIKHTGYYVVQLDTEGGEDKFRVPPTMCETGFNDPYVIGNNIHFDPVVVGGALEGTNAACAAAAVTNRDDDPNYTGGGNQPQYSFDVTLPNTECDNCTLQVIQIMSDRSAYDPTGVDASNFYYRCAKLKISADALPPADAGPDTGADAGTGGGDPDAGTDNGGGNANEGGDGGVSFGCNVGRDVGGAAGGAAFGLLGLFGLAVLRSRRRS